MMGDGRATPGAAPLPVEVESWGKYRPVAKLGQGGMADVFLAVAQGPASFNKLVVVKRLRSAIADNEGHVRMFLDEAQLSARLNHPNIVQTYEVGDEDGSYFIGMEYLEGQPLNRVMRVVARGEPGAEAFTRGFWLRIMADMLSGLHYAHELCDYDGQPLGIVHRDISPHNIFITYEGAVKIVDFGIAKALSNSSKTETGIFKGKAAYVAPEQAAMSRSVDRRADLFATGIVLWELLSGKRLFEGEAVISLHKLVHYDAPRLSTVVPEIPPEIDDIVARALERDPALRYATALELRGAIEAYLRSSGEDVRTEHIAAAMQEMFIEQRTGMRRQIKIYLDRTTPWSVPGSSVPPSRPGTGVRSRFTITSNLPTLNEGSTSTTVTRNERREAASSLRPASVAAPSRTRRYQIAAVGLVAVAAATLISLRLLDRTPTQPAQATQAAATTGILSVLTEPPAATVTWNGRVLGKTPLRADLPEGVQSLIVSMPEFLDETLVVTVSPGATLERSLTLRRQGQAAPGGASAAPSAAPRAAPEASSSPGPRRPHQARVVRETAEPALPTASPSSPPAAAQPQTTAGPGKIQVVDEHDKPATTVRVIDP